jgi:hypothetical protein
MLNTANPIGNSATVLCKIISLIGSFFMAQSFPGFQKLDDHQNRIQTVRWEGGPGEYPPGPCKLTPNTSRNRLKLGFEVGPQSRNRHADHHRDQCHQQAVFHRARTRLIFEKVLDPFHVPAPSIFQFYFSISNHL